MLSGSALPALAFWLALSGAVCVYPVARVIAQGLGALGDEWQELGPKWGLLGASLGWALAVGVLSVAMAWPGAWLSRGWRAWWSPALMAPVLMPSWLVSSGLGLLRGPGTALGDWLAMGPSWRAVLAGRVIAVVGLALWASPIAQLVIASRVREIDPASLEAARLVGRGPRLWVRLRLGMSWRRSALAAGLVSALMLGSAVPMHLAQMETYALRVWLELDATGPGERWRVALAAWPVMVVTAGAGAFACAALFRCGRAIRGEGAELRSQGRAGALVAIAAPALAVVLPAALFAMDLSEAGTLATVWRTEAKGIGWSWAIALAVGAIGGMATVCVWLGLGAGSGLGRWSRRLTVLGVAAAMVTAFLPGVVTGVLAAGAWRGLEDELGPGLVALAHLARFLALPAGLGVLLALTEPGEDRDLRLLSGATGLAGWARTSGVRAWPAVAAGALATAGLSLHEIESAIVVTPPGMPSLARSMLGLLHYQRYEHLAGLALVVIGFGTLVVCGSSGLWWLRERTGRGSTPNE